MCRVGPGAGHPLPPPPHQPCAHAAGSDRARADRVQLAALSAGERARVLAVLHCERFADAVPAQVWATLLDEGVYLASEAKFYLYAVMDVYSRKAVG